MSKWSLDLKHAPLREVHNAFIFTVEDVLTYYLACVAFNEHTVFVGDDLSAKLLRASDDFPDGFTSMKSLHDIDAMRKSGEFSNLVRSHCIFSLVTSFFEFFKDIADMLNISPELTRPQRQLKIHDGKFYKVRPAPLKIAHYITETYGLLGHMTDIHATTYIDSFISLRHMYVHNKGRFHDDYREYVTPRWQKLKSGERIIFGDNDFDDALHFLVMHVRGFVLSLDTKVATAFGAAM